MTLLPALPPPGAPITAAAVAAIEQHIADNVHAVPDIDAAQEWRAAASALEAYLRSKGLQEPILGAERRIEARIGQLLGPPHQGARHDQQLHHHGDEVVTHTQDRFDFRLLARALGGECHLEFEEWRSSRRALVALIRRRLGLTNTPGLPDGTFACIVADPPWQLTTGATMPAKFGDTAIKIGGDHLDYDQMPLDDITDLPVKQLAAPGAHLYLWTVNRYLENAYDVARAWGFEPSAVLTWCKKQMGVGLGGTFRQTSEFIVFARHGQLSADRIVETTWFDWPRGRHSVKPDAFYDLIETVTPGPRLDLFARRTRPGWTTWGYEVQDETA